jgi:uncharacterized pyridoxal phosphate-containing UPF0001 family protein
MKLLNDNRPSNIPPLNICIQINNEREETKSGIPIKDAKIQLIELIEALNELPKLKLERYYVHTFQYKRYKTSY